METNPTPEKRKKNAKFQGKNHYTNNVTVRIQRNQAEKQRRDRLNDQIAQLAILVPPAVNASKPLDKVSILRLSASWMRLNLSCLNEKRFKSAIVNYLDMHHSLVSNLDILEKSINGFIIATTFSGVVLMCSRYSEEYIGYQNIDLLGHNISNFVLPKEKDLLMKKIRNLISRFKNGSSNPRNIVRVRMQQRPLPRSSEMRYRKMSFTLSIHSGGEAPVNPKKTLKIGRFKDFGESAVILIFAEPVQLEPDIDVQYLEEKDCYFTMHGPQGEIIFADHRISIITGYMPQDVLGNSAYQYIHSSDVPIALFAQKDMFTSSDGTGIITYRLRIHDSSLIYLQTKGQIRYKDSTKEVRQFLCCNILLNDKDGNRELKKFQDKYAPQISTSKIKEIKLPKESEKDKNADCCTLTKNNSTSIEPENLKRKIRSPALTHLKTDAQIEMKEQNTVENLMNFCSDSEKNKDRVDCDQSQLLSSNSVSYSSNNSFKSVVPNGFDNAYQTVQVINLKRAKYPETLSCNVQDSVSTLNTSDHTSPEEFMTHSNNYSIPYAKPVYFENNHALPPGNSTDSTLLTSDLLMIPDELTVFDTVSGKKVFPTDKLMSSQYMNPDDSQKNASDITLTNNIEMAIGNLLTPLDALQNHETICSESLFVDKNSYLLQNGQRNVNNYISHNHFASFGPKLYTDISGSQSISKAQDLCAAQETVPTSDPQANLDLSFLDPTVQSMALLSDLSDFYDNSVSLSNGKYLNQYQNQTEVISYSSDKEYCSRDSNDVNGANFQGFNELGLYKQISPDSHISNNATSFQQFHNYSPNSSYLTLDCDLVQTNDMLMKTLNGEYFQTSGLGQDCQIDNSAIHCSLTQQKANSLIFSQLQANTTITRDDREGHKPPRNGIYNLYPGMNTHLSFLNHAQNEQDMKKPQSTSVFQFLEERTK